MKPLRAGLVIFCFVMFCGSFALADELGDGVAWAIFHEGCAVYNGNVMKNIGDIRQCIYDKQQHNTRFESVLSQANDATLLASVKIASKNIPVVYDLRQNMWWVMYHEGRAEDFRERLRDQPPNFGSIRDTYQLKQDHNPNARNLLAAVSDDYIRNLINSL